MLSLPVQNTALHLAAEEGHVSAVTMLMTSGAEFLRNKEGDHFLDLAIKREHKDACVAIVSHDRCSTKHSSTLTKSFFLARFKKPSRI